MKQTQQQKYQNDENESWDQLDHIEGKNLQNYDSDHQESMENNKYKNKAKLNVKKANQIHQYQKALLKLRKQCKVYYNPLEKHKLNLGLMPARKMLSDAHYKEKDYVLTLRSMGVKTRLRVRNKGVAKQLLLDMLVYVESGKVPQKFIEMHKQLLTKQFSELEPIRNYIN